MLLAELVAASQRIGATRSKSAKVEILSELLRRLVPNEARAAVAWLSGELAQGRIGIGWATVREMKEVPPAAEATLALAEIDAELEAIARASGGGSAGERRRRLGALFARATPDEQDFLGRLLLGGLRQGALEGVMLDAVARAT